MIRLYASRPSMPGSKVNVEADLIARYVQRLASYGKYGRDVALTAEFLKDKGFL